MLWEYVAPPRRAHSVATTKCRTQSSIGSPTTEVSLTRGYLFICGLSVVLTAHLLVTPGFEWVAVTRLLPLCACPGRHWVDLYLLYLFIYVVS